MLEVRIAESLVRVGCSGFEPGGWSVLIYREGVVVREYRCRDFNHARAVATSMRRGG